MHLKFSYKCMTIFVNMYRNVTKSFPEISVYYKSALTASKTQKISFKIAVQLQLLSVVY